MADSTTTFRAHSFLTPLPAVPYGYGPGSQSETMAYDSLGRPASITDFNGRTLDYVYDPNTARIQQITDHTTGTVLLSYTYNPDGTVHSATKGNVQTTFDYDSLGRRADTTTQIGDGPAETIYYGYDAAGNIVWKQTPSMTASARLQYSYYPDGRLHQVTHPDGAASTYTYYNNGALHTFTRASGLTTTYTYDNLNRLTDVTNSVGPWLHYARLADGKVSAVTESMTSTAGTTSYQYDANGELLSESGPGVNNVYTYDGVGNRLSKTDSTGTTQYSYDANDRLTSTDVNGFITNIGYDANGNQLGVDGEAATYDYNNKLTGIGNSAAFTYDATGNRVQAAFNGQTTNYVVDPSGSYADVVEERDASNNLLARYDHGNGLIRMDRGGIPYYYVTDGMGSVRALANSSGALTGDAYTYDAYGMLTSSPQPTANPFLHNGEQADPTGLYYLRDRYYDPSTGRFLGVDPAGGSPYRYADNNPVSNSDPSGRDTIGELAVTMDLASNLASYDYGGIAINYYRQWDPTFGEVNATINQSGGSDSIGLYQVGTGSLNNDVDSQIKNYESGFLAGLGNSVASAIVGLGELGVNVGAATSPAGALLKQVFDSYFDPQTLAVLSDPFYASGPGANYGMEQGKFAGMVAQLFVPGVGEEEFAADVANIEKELPTLEKFGQDAEQAIIDTCENSFKAGTPVRMADGTVRAIEQIKPGDWVLSRDPLTYRVEPSQVTVTVKHIVTATVTVVVVDEAGLSAEITCTPEHPFYVPGKNWLAAGDLVPHDILLTGNGQIVTVTSVIPHSSEAEPVPVYNLTVGGDHSYFVGRIDDGLWVHNAGCTQLHHQLPLEFADEFADLADGSLDVDDWVTPLDTGFHRDWIHGSLKDDGTWSNGSLGGYWNAEWRAFFDSYAARGVKPGIWDVMDKLKELREENYMSHLPIFRYPQRLIDLRALK